MYTQQRGYFSRLFCEGSHSSEGTATLSYNYMFPAAIGADAGFSLFKTLTHVACRDSSGG